MHMVAFSAYLPCHLCSPIESCSMHPAGSKKHAIRLSPVLESVYFRPEITPNSRFLLYTPVTTR